MALTFRWTGDADRERVVETRMRCYGRAGREREQFQKRLIDDPRSADGDFLLAEESLPGGRAEAVGTVTSLSLKMWMRGSPFACQGIAWVGTVRTHRRQGGANKAERGIASQLMLESLRKGRERGQVVSALMPFRASFYEHFGYGVVETRNVWTVPLSLLPSGSSAGMRYGGTEDAAAMAALYQRAVEAGQCNIERGEARWRQAVQSSLDDGFLMVDPAPDGRGLRGFSMFQHQHQDGKDIIEIADSLGLVYEDTEALRRQLHFLASQRDQFSGVILRLPVDLPLPWLLRERQIAHRPVNHPASTVSPHTRMQIRVLDHVKLLEHLRLPAQPTGKVIVCIQESEGHESRLALDLHDGRISAASVSASPTFTCADHTWASIVCGTLRASTAWQMGLVEAENASAAQTLDQLASPEAGPMPFCQEYF
jgi:predicted acetyltransferase